jgi:predicted anti-sigma-YlaC factor YlaD
MDALECDAVRESIDELEWETPNGLTPSPLAEHLRSCSSCAAWLDSADSEFLTDHQAERPRGTRAERHSRYKAISKRSTLKHNQGR